MNTLLESQIRTEYMKNSILYNRILRSRIIQLKNFDTRFSMDINKPSKSLNPIQAEVFWYHIGLGGGGTVSVSPLFVVQLPPNLA